MTQEELGFRLIGVGALILAASFQVWRYFSLPWKEEEPVIPEGSNELKTWPKFFGHVFDGSKTFEVRKHDRDFQVGDMWYLREYVPPTVSMYEGADHVLGGRYKGSWVKVRITYLMEYGSGPRAGVSPGYCVFGFRVLEKYDTKTGLHLNERGLII